MPAPLKWSYKTGTETDWCKSTADQKTRTKAINKIFSASIGQNCVVLVDDKSDKGDGSTVKVNIDSGDWKGEYFLSLPTQNAADSVDVRLCAYWKNDVFFLTTDATATAWDGGSYNIQKSRLSAHMLMYACRIVEPDGTVKIYYVSTKLNADGKESLLLDVFPMLNRFLHYSDTAQDSARHPVLPAYPIPSSVTSAGKTVSPVFGNLPNHMPGVFYSPDGEIGHDKNYSIMLNGRSIRMCATGSVFFLVDA
jgi:hypothetical protein